MESRMYNAHCDDTMRISVIRFGKQTFFLPTEKCLSIFLLVHLILTRLNANVFLVIHRERTVDLLSRLVYEGYANYSFLKKKNVLSFRFGHRMS